MPPQNMQPWNNSMQYNPNQGGYIPNQNRPMGGYNNFNPQNNMQGGGYNQGGYQGNNM